MIFKSIEYSPFELKAVKVVCSEQSWPGVHQYPTSTTVPADLGTLRAPELLLSHSSCGPQLSTMPGSGRDSDDSAPVPPSNTYPNPIGIPRWLGADAGRRILQAPTLSPPISVPCIVDPYRPGWSKTEMSLFPLFHAPMIAGDRYSCVSGHGSLCLCTRSLSSFLVSPLTLRLQPYFAPTPPPVWGQYVAPTLSHL